MEKAKGILFKIAILFLTGFGGKMQYNELLEVFFLLFGGRYFELLGGQSYLNSLRTTKLIYHRKKRVFFYPSITQAKKWEASCCPTAGVAKPAPAAKQACFALGMTPPFAIPISDTDVRRTGAYSRHIY